MVGMANDRSVSPPPAATGGSSAASDKAARSAGGSNTAASADVQPTFDRRRLTELVDEGSAEAELLVEPTTSPRSESEWAALFDEAEALCAKHLDPSRPVTIRAGEEYYLVSARWASVLRANLARLHARAAKQQPERRGSGKLSEEDAFWSPIDNADLVQRYTKWGADLRANLLEIENYLLVTGRVWRKLTEMFGGGPELSRDAFEDGNLAVVDVRGISVRAVHSRDLDHFKRVNFSKYASAAAVLRELCRRFDVADSGTARLWTLDEQDGLAECLAPKPGASLLDLGVAPEEIIVLEEQELGEDGKLEWPTDRDEGKSASERASSAGRRASFDLGRARPVRVLLPGRIGLFNLRNSCYMNSTLQCLSNIPPLRSFFVSDDFLGDLNEDNPLGTNGVLARAFSALMREVWLLDERPPRAVLPDRFKKVLDEVHPDFEGCLQHDSQELLSYLLDDLHEDVNRVRRKEMTLPVESGGRPDSVVAAEARSVYAKRNDSRVSDLCTGMLLSKVSCPTRGCHNVSATFDPFMMLPLPVEAAPERFRTVEVTVVPHASPLRRSVVRVRVAAKGPSVLLRNAVAVAAGVDAHSLLLAELSQHRIVRVLADNVDMDAIGIDAELYALEDPRTIKHVQMLHGTFLDWLRPTLANSGGKIELDQNLLPEEEEDERRRRRSDEPVPPPLPGIEHIRVAETAGGFVEVWPVLASHGPETPAMAALRAEASGSLLTHDACPFRRGQMWYGHFQRANYAVSRQSVRYEVVHVEKTASGAYRVFAMIDVNHLFAGGRHFEQESRLAVGEYLPAALASAAARRRRNDGKGETAADKNARRAEAKAAEQEQAEKAGKKKPAKRSSASRFSPKGLFGGRGSNSTSNSASSSAAAGKGSGVAAAVRRSLKRRSGAAGKASDKSASEASGEPEPADPEDEERLAHMGDATLDVGAWRALYETYEDEPSVLKSATDFRVRGSVDANGVVFYGRILFGDRSGGNYSSEASNTMDFFLRLAPPEQQTQANAQSSSRESARLGLLDRKLGLNSTRGVRYVSRLVGGDAALPADHAYARTEYALDPGVFIVDAAITEGQLVARVHAHFADLYNDCRGAERDLKLDEAVRAQLRALPASLTAEDVARGVRVLRAGKNYTLYSPGERSVGMELDPQGRDVFFSSKHSFLRVVLEWEQAHPVVALFAAMDAQLLADGRGGLARARRNLGLVDCMDLLCKSETLSEHDSWFCDKCKTHSAATKTLQVWNFPRVLILHLKRFSQQPDGEFTDKLPNQIDFPLEGLDLRRFALEPDSKLHALYDLCAVSSHYGGMGSGHYTAYARNEEDGVWYEFDDDIVLPVRVVELITSSAAYVLFYMRRDLRPQGWGEPGAAKDLADDLIVV